MGEHQHKDRLTLNTGIVTFLLDRSQKVVHQVGAVHQFDVLRGIVL